VGGAARLNRPGVGSPDLSSHILLPLRQARPAFPRAMPVVGQGRARTGQSGFEVDEERFFVRDSPGVLDSGVPQDRDCAGKHFLHRKGPIALLRRQPTCERKRGI
jgi:hypothetical protein